MDSEKITVSKRGLMESYKLANTFKEGLIDNIAKNLIGVRELNAYKAEVEKYKLKCEARDKEIARLKSCSKPSDINEYAIQGDAKELERLVKDRINSKYSSKLKEIKELEEKFSRS